ncbi:LuxR family transcriptional activator of conjugal transfer of Ti plasmids [Pseudorhizobium tarimense]|uniref:LuxR family transcriptional activator of conjugal transfer of Ti plasmids n=2 Tax=Pseudorhizobium tarimense TaxID=1079109 RepID=A0ABV2HBY6_9HYPH
MDEWFEHLTEQVILATDDDKVRISLQRLTRKAGFEAFAYVDLQPHAIVAISNYPQEWQEQYLRLSYRLVDPILRDAKRHMKAFSWSNTLYRRADRATRGFCAQACDFGIRSGLSIPIRTGFGTMAMLTLASSSEAGVADEEINPVFAAAAVGQLHMRLTNLRQLRKPSHNVRLKIEELTCLRWSAEGKSMRAIAVIQKTTYANVRFYLGNAKFALGAATLPQATARATAWGII